MIADHGRFDVVVIGGGSAGLAAAITAARSGARTIIIERHGYAGGMGTASLVHSFCGLYLLRGEPGAVLANPGFCGEIEQRMIAATGIGPQRMGRLDVLPQHPVEFVRIADEMLVSEPMLETLFHTEVCGIERDSEKWRISLACRTGAMRVSASAIVDASGDAVVAAWLGRECAVAPAEKLQRPAYVFGVHCAAALDEAARLRISGMLCEGIREGLLPPEALGLTFRASGRQGEVFGTLDLTGNADGRDFDPMDASCLSGLEFTGRQVAAAVVRYLAGREDAWRGAYISNWPAKAGIRESRRWIGEYVLTGEDLLESRRFDDEIALATWPMEMRETAKGPKLKFPKKDHPAGIPLRCLKPAGTDRLFVAGRCISADHEAQASIRVMGTCFATGEAAGRAAARCLR
jgi:hypothetical protein